ncbi:alpha-2-macroglobulin-like protein 1 isoform X2 [Penaeus chinensis]|uniref:alpha-2-macroglobulin-like protein 1 isoform X2 n=1 Tax=Penaeus chinensis TaxID=139456 RepID=UPI001FB6ED66|nr:alpha-2-macroglobulin-like protein 1 isoform X2 [Penaeus chinensis]
MNMAQEERERRKSVMVVEDKKSFLRTSGMALAPSLRTSVVIIKMFMRVADFEGGFADVGDGGSAAVEAEASPIICPEILCFIPEEDNCTEVPGVCCSQWICGDGPSECALDTGEVYQIGDTWTNECEICNCLYSSKGAVVRCYKRYCIPPPHRACVEVFRDGECCPDYHCNSTTCRYENRYYGVGESWQTDDNCQTCSCNKGDPIPEIKCDAPEICKPAPSPACRPIVSVQECCPVEWDCSDAYLITVPKVFVRGRQSTVCVFLVDDPPISVNLTFEMTIGLDEIRATVLDTVSDSHVCVDFPVPAGGEASGFLSIMGTVGAVHLSKELRIHLLSVDKTFVQTDKYLYEEGQLVQFRVLSVKGERAAISYENLDEVWITSPMETRLMQWLNVSNDRGLVQLEFPLAEHVQEGTYTIHVRTEGRITSQAFKVEPYVLPRFEVTVHPPPYTLVSQTTITVEVCADYTYGQPVTGSGNLFVKKHRYYYYEMDTMDDVLTIPIPTFSGCTDVEVDTSLINTEGYGFIGKLALTADITEEGTGHMASGTATIQLASQRLSFTQISRVKDAKPGLPFEMQIQARFPDETGAPGVEVKACVDTACKNFVTDQHGVFSVMVPPHLVEPQGKLKVTLANEDAQEGNLGHLYPSVAYFYFSVYYSESNSSLSLAIPTDALDCTPGEDIGLSLPVLFVANNINTALMRVQVISRSQVVFTNSFAQALVASDLPLDETALLEPMADLEAGFVRGSFTLELNIPYYASPSVNVLIWYSTGAGEVIAASGTVEVSTCLPTVADLAWAPSNTAAPKDDVQITITATPNSVCSLGVVDRSVEILSRGKTGSLSTATVFQLLKGTEPHMWLNSQIDNYAYCSGHSTTTYYDDVLEDLPVAKRSYYWMPFTSMYIDALSAFNDATVLVLSDLTIETRPCERQDGGFHPIYMDGAGVAYGDMVDEAAPVQIADGADSESEGAMEEEEEIQEPRSYFPETWLWDIHEIGETGSTSFSVKVPDTVTEWVGEAVCVNSEFGLGLSRPATLTVFTPFFLDLTMPPSVRRQERVPLRVSVFNYMDQTLPVIVILTPNTTFTADELTTSVCVPANSMQVAEFIVVPQEAGEIWLTFSASVSSDSENCAAGNDLPTKSDVMIKPLKVVFEGVQREMVNSVFICGDDASESWSLSTPSGIIEASERVFVSASADLLGPTIENLGHLVRKPYGCGEQNMINFVPNIHVVRYLHSIGQGDSDIVDQATSFMITGYQRELTYRRDDGSYSAFGDNDPEGSTWLTAFVLRSFAQASEYITIDDHDLQMSADWLLSLQMEDGCFQSVGQVHHTAMKGGLGSTSSSAVPLSAYVVIALSEAGHFGMEALPAAVSCIQSDTAATDVYSESLKAYALALSSSADAPGHITSAYNLLTAGDEGESIWVESAAYAVLAMLKVDHAAYVAQVIDLIRRLSSHRNSLGGFHSTQDTILALQAFAEYSILFPPSNTNLELTVTAITSFNFLFLPVNQSVALTREIEDPLPYNVTVTPSGTGCAVFMVVHRFYMPEVSANSIFSLTVASTSGSCTTANVTVCAFYLLADEESNMVIVELDLESGYVAEEGSLQHLVDGRVIKKYEQDEPGIVELYLDSLSSTEVCLTVAVSREILVEDVKPGTVSIYDYYQNSEDKLVKQLAIDRTGCANSSHNGGMEGLA